MALTEHDHVIQTLPADTVHDTLHIRVLPRAIRGRDDLDHLQAVDTLTECRAIDTIAVPKEIRWGLLPGKRLDHLLCGPLGGRMLCHIEVDVTPSFVSQNHQDKPHFLGDRWHDTEIQGNQIVHMVPDKGLPRRG
jgi:hypothetical protein